MGLTYPNLVLGMLVQISRNRLIYVLLMLLIMVAGNHNFAISCRRRFIGPGTCPPDPKTFFADFWDGQIHVYFEPACCDFGDYLLTYLLTDITKISMQ